MIPGKKESLVLVPINGTDCDGRALDVAVMLAKRGHAEVVAMHIVEVPQELPLETDMAQECSHGADVLHDAEKYASQCGRDIDVELLQARSAGPAIVDEAIQRGASLIVMSTTVRRRAGEMTAGRTTVPYVLKNAPCEVVVCRRPLEDGSCSEPGGTFAESRTAR